MTTLKLSKLLSKGFKDHIIGMNIKQNLGRKTWRMNMDIFSNKTLQEFTDCVFWFIQDQDELAKRYKSRSCCLPKCVIKNYNAIS